MIKIENQRQIKLKDVEDNCWCKVIEKGLFSGFIILKLPLKHLFILNTNEILDDQGDQINETNYDGYDSEIFELEVEILSSRIILFTTEAAGKSVYS